MALPANQIEQIRKQLIEQITTTYPEDKKDSAMQQINSMDDEQLEEFLIQNNLINGEGESAQQCVFCSIISEKILSYKISENEDAIAVLEINPISRGHTIIIPKPHVQEVSKETQEFASQISLKLKEKLQAKEIKQEDSEMFGHKTINLIPIYSDETLKNERKPISKKELESLQKELQMEIEPEKEIEEITEEEEPITDKNTWLPRRIP